MAGSPSPVRRLPGRTSKALVLVMIMVAAAFVAAGVAATAQNAIVPLAQGQSAARERHLSRDSVALSIHVGAIDADGNAVRVEGAIVTLSRDGADEPIAVQRTDASGRALFHLRPGAYHGLIEYREMTGERDFALRQDTRAVLVFDQEGDLHEFRHDRREIQERGETYSLTVVVRQMDEAGNARPVEAARILVHRADREGATDDVVARGLTGPRGAAVFNIHHGAYVVSIETPEGATAQARILLDSDKAIGFVVDADGEVHVRGGSSPRR